MLEKFFKLKLSKFNINKDSQYESIKFILVTFEKSKLFKFKDFNDLHS